MRIAVVGFLLAACSTSVPARPPTAVEAGDFLTQVVATAQSGDLEALCAMGGGSCEDFLNEQGGRVVPALPPEIVGGRVVEPTRNGGGGTVAGYILEMCGEQDDGEKYYSEMLVFFDFNGELRGIEPPYWMGLRISDNNQAGQHLNDDRADVC